jgi:hypothetical protein
MSRQRSEVRLCRTYADHTVFAKAALLSRRILLRGLVLERLQPLGERAFCRVSSAKKVCALRANIDFAKCRANDPSASRERNG